MGFRQMEKGEGAHLLKDDLIKKQMHSPAKKGNKPFSWLRCLCWTVAILGMLSVISLVGIAFGLYFWIRYEVMIFTVEGQKDMPNPPLPVSPIPDVELEVIKDEVKLFWDQLRAGTVPPQDLIMTQEDHSVESGNTHLVTTLTPKNHVKDLDFPTILKGKFVVYRDDTEEGKPVLELDYGQFLNWLAPDDWIER